MFFKIDRQTNLLVIDPFFVSLKKIENNDDLKFEFTYKVNQVQMIEKQYTTVRITVLSKNSQTKTLLENSSVGNLNSRDLIDKILNQSQNAKKTNKQQLTNVVYQTNSDFSSKISNEIVTRLKSGQSRESILQLRKNVLRPQIVRDVDGMQPVLQFSSHKNMNDNVTSSINFNEQDVMYRMITERGIDPSYVTELSHRSIAAKNSFEGVLRKQKTSENETDLITQLVNRHLLGESFANKIDSSQFNDETTMIQVIENVVDEYIEIPVEVVILGKLRKSLKTNIFIVNFELIDSKTNSSVQIFSKELDVSSYINAYYTPQKRPLVSISNISSVINFDIKQTDPGAESVVIYKKAINPVSVDNDDYKLISTILLSPGKNTIFSVENPQTTSILYRFISVGKQGTLGSEYTNIVLKPRYHVQDKSLSLSANMVETGIEVTLGSFPPNIISAEILAKDLSIFERDYRNVGNTNTLITNDVKIAGSFSLIDSQVMNYHVYEYIARMTFASGVEYSKSSIIECIPYEQGKIDIVISDVEIRNELDNPNVKFLISAKIIDSESQVTKELLELNGLADLFKPELVQERDLINDLIAFNVQRINLSTGDREDFGIITTNIFDDTLLQKSTGVSPLNFGHRYQYEISTALRSPETLFSTLFKDVIDPTTKKPYKYSPSKNRHPLTLREGILVSKRGLKTSSKNAFMHGQIGFFESLNVTFDKKNVEIIELSVERFDKHSNILTWKILGDINEVDHFLIMKDVHGIRTIIGKCHGNFHSGNVQFFHQYNSYDKGELKYIVVLIRNDYTINSDVVSNSLVVEEE